MEIPAQLLCLYSGVVERRDGTYVVEVPASEIDRGDLEVGDTYRVAMLSGGPGTGSSGSRSGRESSSPAGSAPSTGPSSSSGSPDRGSGRPDRTDRGPPVSEGDTREVEIDDIGDQGDGIARVERGFVVIVPDTDQGERVTVEVTDVRENVAFAEVVERHSYYE